jgi:hypothetical protein
MRNQKNSTNRPVFKRCNLTLDLTTLRKCRELADQCGGQSISATVRFAIARAYEHTVLKRAAAGRLADNNR